MKSKDVKGWRNNRPSSLLTKIRRWKSNTFGATIRFLEILYFGQPLFNVFIGNNGKNGNSSGIELIRHMSKSISPNLSNQHYIFLENVRVDMRENFIQLDTGHVLNPRKSPNDLFSGQYWDQVRGIQKSRISNRSNDLMVYPIANQNFFYHFLLEELPEIISAHTLGLAEKFVSLENQPPYVIELLDLAGIKVEYIEGNIHSFRKVICPTYSRSDTSWPIDQLQTLIRRDGSEFYGPRKILLLREGEARSDIDFEKSLRDFLIPKGFECVDPKLLSNLEQIKLFENVKDIVAIHGGALSNIVFTGKDSRIFEIFNHKYRTYFFRDIAWIKGNRYVGAEFSEAFEQLKTWLDADS
jgi:capsular polysaccharide biosynthesis protein